MYDSIVIYPKIGKLILLGFGSFLFVVLGVIFAFNQVELGISLFAVIIASYIGVPFFGLCFLYYVKRIIIRKPSLVVNKDGITDNSSLISIGLMKWSEIERIYLYDYMGQKFIGIIPYDYQSIISNIHPMKKAVINMNKRMIEAPINIVQNTVSVPLEQIIEYSKEYIKIEK